MHGSHNNHDSRMMWMMMLACLLPIVLISFAGGGFAGNNWLLIGVGVVIFALAHIIMMRSGHGGTEDTKTNGPDASSESANKMPDVHSH